MKRYTREAKTQPQVRVGYYNPKCKRDNVVQDLQKAHFLIGARDPLRIHQDIPMNVSGSSNAEFYQDHNIDPYNHLNDQRRLKKVSKSMRSANFRFSTSNHFYNETSHHIPSNNKVDDNSVRRSQIVNHKSNFVLGSAPNDYSTVFNNDYQMSNTESQNAAQNSSQSKQKSQRFRKHNYIVGYSKPDYTAKSDLKTPDLNKTVDFKSLQRKKKESIKSHFKFGHEDVQHQFLNQTLYPRIDRPKESKLSPYTKARYKQKTVFSLMKQQNIVYGYEKLSPASTSTHFYSSTMRQMPSQRPEIDTQKLRQSSLEFGQSQPEYETSNRMNPIKVESNRPSQHRSNKSHFQLSQGSPHLETAKTTYKENISDGIQNRKGELSMSLVGKPKDNTSSIVLGYQKHQMVTEAKDSFNGHTKTSGARKSRGNSKKLFVMRFQVC